MKTNDSDLISYIHYIASTFDELKVAYTFVESASLWIQGVKVEKPFEIKVQFQWDGLDDVYQRFLQHKPSPLVKDPFKASFYFNLDEITVRMECLFNRTVRTDPYRISIQSDESELWCLSIYSALYSEDKEDSSQLAIHQYLLEKQKSVTANNEEAWNQNQYNALVNRYGDPKLLAQKIVRNPEWRLHPFRKYLGHLKGKKVAHLMGSNGIKAVALSILGADVTVVDFSRENQQYAEEIAENAEVSMTYLLEDILSLQDRSELHQQFDLVLMELGVLHYFLDLQPLFAVVQKLLLPGGVFILHEFHPISTKLITSSGKKHKITGNYFDPTIEENQVAFSKHVNADHKKELNTVLQRKWTLGEVITFVAKSGLTIQVLEEEPNHKAHDIGLPKTYTLVAQK